MKICLLTALIVLTLLSCNQPKENSSENEKLIKQYFEHFNKHDWDKMAAMYSDTAAFKDPSLGQGIVKQTKAEIVKKYDQLSQIFPDVKDEVVSVYPSGDQHIIVEFVSTGTAPDSSKFELPICTVFKIENGLITQDFTYFDNFEEK